MFDGLGPSFLGALNILLYVLTSVMFNLLRTTLSFIFSSFAVKTKNFMKIFRRFFVSKDFISFHNFLTEIKKVIAISVLLKLLF